MSNTDDDPNRAFVRALFAPDPDEPGPDPDEPDEQQKPPIANHVPREGNSPKPRNNDQDMREFTRNLFDRVTD